MEMSQVFAAALRERFDRTVAARVIEHLLRVRRRAAAARRRCGRCAARPALTAVGHDLHVRWSPSRSTTQRERRFRDARGSRRRKLSQVVDRACRPARTTRSPGASPARSAAPPATICADHRLERRPVEPQPDALERVGLHVVGRKAAQIERARRRDCRASVCTSRRSASRCSAACSTRQRSSCQVVIGVAVDRADRVARMQARLRGDACRRPARRGSGRASGRPYMKRPA